MNESKPLPSGPMPQFELKTAEGCSIVGRIHGFDLHIPFESLYPWTERLRFGVGDLTEKQAGEFSVAGTLEMLIENQELYESMRRAPCAARTRASTIRALVQFALANDGRSVPTLESAGVGSLLGFQLYADPEVPEGIVVLMSAEERDAWLEERQGRTKTVKIRRAEQ